MAIALTSVLAFGTARSQAGLIGGLLGCSGVTYTQPFAQWGDRNSYFLATGGSFEGSNSWGLAGGAQVVAENEPLLPQLFLGLAFASAAARQLRVDAGNVPGGALAAHAPRREGHGRVSRARGRLRERAARPDQASGLGQHRPLELVGPERRCFAAAPERRWRSRTSARRASSSASRRSAPRRCRLDDVYVDPRCSTSRALSASAGSRGRPSRWPGRASAR